MMQAKEKKLTGYPSIDKPWLKYYKNTKCLDVNPEQTIYSFIKEINEKYLDDVAIEYFGRKITYRQFMLLVEKCRDNLASLGITEGDIITIQTLAIPQSYILLYAASLIGACANFVYVTSTEEEVKASLIETKSKLYVVIDKIYQKMKSDILKETSVQNVMLLSCKMALYCRR